jgi:hypothetical protein
MRKCVPVRQLGPYLGCIFVFGLLFCPELEGATRASVDKIRSNSPISDANLTTLDEFVREQFQSLVLAKDATEASKVAKELAECTQSMSNVTPTRKSYSDSYSRAVKGVYGQALQQAQKKQQSQDPIQQKIGGQISLSTVIIMAMCDNLILADDLVRMLDSPSEEIRYWAAKGLAGKNLHSALTTSRDNVKYIKPILQGLNKCLGQTNSEGVIANIAVATDLLDKKASVTILQQCLKKRIDHYQQWQVIDESTDMVLLLQVLTVAGDEDIYGDEAARKNLLQSVADFYTLAYQRYVNGLGYRDGNTPLPLLQDQNRQALGTLLIEGERKIQSLAATRGNIPISGPRFAAGIKSGKPASLDLAYRELIGQNGVTERAWKITGKLKLPKPPQGVVDRARTLRDIQKNLIEE